MTYETARGDTAIGRAAAPSSASSYVEWTAILAGAVFAVALSRLGPLKLTVTTNFQINFLHRAHPADLLAEGRILKCGKRLVVMEVTVHCDGHNEPVAHATGTYSIPPQGAGPAGGA